MEVEHIVLDSGTGRACNTGKRRRAWLEALSSLPATVPSNRLSRRFWAACNLTAGKGICSFEAAFPVPLVTSLGVTSGGDSRTARALPTGGGITEGWACKIRGMQPHQSSTPTPMTFRARRWPKPKSLAAAKPSSSSPILDFAFASASRARLLGRCPRRAGIETCKTDAMRTSRGATKSRKPHLAGSHAVGLATAFLPNHTIDGTFVVIVDASGSPPRDTALRPLLLLHRWHHWRSYDADLSVRVRSCSPDAVSSTCDALRCWRGLRRPSYSPPVHRHDEQTVCGPREPGAQSSRRHAACVSGGLGSRNGLTRAATGGWVVGGGIGGHRAWRLAAIDPRIKVVLDADEWGPCLGGTEGWSEDKDTNDADNRIRYRFSRRIT
uniref:Uncharacterized protein n=1 Tax=Mycena chlorophos TaxID=658473 RepID=A0ABQ0LU96_MYCCL|nr:predicted protein [Mycena chlorophos]